MNATSQFKHFYFDKKISRFNCAISAKVQMSERHNPDVLRAAGLNCVLENAWKKKDICMFQNLIACKIFF